MWKFQFNYGCDRRQLYLWPHKKVLFLSVGGIVKLRHDGCLCIILRRASSFEIHLALFSMKNSFIMRYIIYEAHPSSLFFNLWFLFTQKKNLPPNALYLDWAERRKLCTSLINAALAFSLNGFFRHQRSIVIELKTLWNKFMMSITRISSHRSNTTRRRILVCLSAFSSQLALIF